MTGFSFLVSQLPVVQQVYQRLDSIHSVFIDRSVVYSENNNKENDTKIWISIEHVFVTELKILSQYYIITLFVLSQCMLGEGNGTPLQYSCLENPMDGGAWQASVNGVAKSQTGLSDFTFTFHFHSLEKEMTTHSNVLAWRIPGMGEPGGLPSLGSHRVGHD